MTESDIWFGTAGMIFTILGFAIVAWISTVVISRLFDLQKTRVATKASVTQEQEYRRLAQQATRAQEDVAAQLQRLDGVEARLAEIERMLREVDEPALTRR